MVEDLETAYLSIIEEVIRAAGNIPRYATYTNAEGVCFLQMLPDGSFLRFILAQDKSKTYHNVVTCFLPTSLMHGQKWAEYRDKVIQKICYEGGSSIIWCTKKTWSIACAQMNGSRNKIQGKRKDSRRPYRRLGGAGNWRKYLDDWE